MRKSIYTYALILSLPVMALMSSCEANVPTEDKVVLNEDQVAEQTADGRIYTLNEFLDTFMSKEGDFASDSMATYRTRSHNAGVPDIWLFTVDTIPQAGPGIYIRGRVTTDDYAGNFYKALVIQQIVNGEQQNLRISVDLGSAGGMYQIGQEILIRCNGLAVGRYASQPQLCIPTYNNNIYADKYPEKIGWAPGRIPGPTFRSAVQLIGSPDQSQLQYKEVSLAQLYKLINQTPTLTAAGYDSVGKADGMLVRLKKVSFTGQYITQQGKFEDCDTQHPDSSEYANVFGPTTNNVGYPQGRVVANQSGKVIVCSTSEYAKFAHFYLPGADKSGVSQCKYFEGTVTGILGWYFDNAKYLPVKGASDSNWESYKYKWSITPRGIPGFGMEDIKMYYQGDTSSPWEPKEFDPHDE